MQCAKELQSPLHPREPDAFCSFSSDPVRLILGKVTGTGLRFRGLGVYGCRDFGYSFTEVLVPIWQSTNSDQQWPSPAIFPMSDPDLPVITKQQANKVKNDP